MRTTLVFLFALLVASTACQHVVATKPAVESLRPASSDDFVFRAEPEEISDGQESVLEWKIRGADKVVIEEAVNGEKLHSLGTFDAAGMLRVKPKESSTYVISCGDVANLACASVNVKVRIKL